MSFIYIYIHIHMEHLFLMFLDHTQRRTTVGRTPLDEWSDRRRDLYLTTHDTHNRQISMPPVGIEPYISAGERPAAAHLLRSWVAPVVDVDTVVCAPDDGWRCHPKHVKQFPDKINCVKLHRGKDGTGFTSSNSSTVAAGSSIGVANTRCCRYSRMRSWWWVVVPPETCKAVSR